MKFSRLTLGSALLAVGFTLSTPVLAAGSDTAQVEVKATVQAGCMFDTKSATISLVIDPKQKKPTVSESTDLDFWCTKGTGYSFQVLSANGFQLKDAASNLLTYTATASAETNQGGGIDVKQTAKVTVQLDLAEYSKATADAEYSDKLTVSLNY